MIRLNVAILLLWKVESFEGYVKLEWRCELITKR